MKTVYDAIQSVAQSLSVLQEQYDTLRRLQQQFDIQVNDIYHEIETSKFNARDGYKYAKKLQDVLRQRRIIKTQLGSAMVAVNTIKPNLLIDKVSKLAEKCQQSIDNTYDYLGVENVGGAE